MFELEFDQNGAYYFVFECKRASNHEYLRLDVVAEAVAWCKERFGLPTPHHFEGRWCRTTETEIAFRDQIDAMDFRLRWC